MHAVIENPTTEDQKIAKSSSKMLDLVRTNPDMEFIEIKLKKSNDLIKIPIKAFNLLTIIVHKMANGESLALIPVKDILSTQESADFLNVSRPYIVKLLEKGEIPFEKVGTHRRVKFSDLLLYKERLQKARKKELSYLSRQAREINPNY